MSDSTNFKDKPDPTLVENEAASLRGLLDDVKCVAKGGMAHIFRARQPSLDRYIAVKKLKDELVQNEEMVARFRREAKALASVLHQNVAHVYDFVEGVRESYIVMEYIDGIDVSTVIEKVGHLPPVIAAGILLGVARGVSYIHAHNLIHRDIKPSNIRVTNRGGVKLMDFGIVMDADSESLTRPGMMVGSPSYLSPEQVLGDALSPRADLFLLGIVFYEMLAGTRPFREENGETVFQRIREAKYIPVRKIKQTVPKELERIVKKLLEKKPDDRYENAKALIADLERYLGATRSSQSEELILEFLDEEALITPSFDYQAVNEPLHSSWFQRASTRLILSGLLLGTVFFGLGYFIGHESHPAPPIEMKTIPLSKIPRR